MYLADNVQDGDWVTQAAADESFTFYCMEYQVTANCDDKLPANPNQSVEEIEELLAARSKEYPALWYVANPPPDWANAHAAENWLTENMQLVRDVSADGMRAQEFMPWDVPEIAREPQATFGDAAQLADYDVFHEPNGDMTVLLYWRALAQIDTPLKVFLHATDGAQIVAQDDQYPQNGRISTDTWEVGKVYRDVYRLSLPPTPGAVELVVGFYDPETNRRLPVGDGDSYTVQVQ
jgi:hypothetical protein